MTFNSKTHNLHVKALHLIAAIGLAATLLCPSLAFADGSTSTAQDIYGSGQVNSTWMEGSHSFYQCDLWGGITASGILECEDRTAADWTGPFNWHAWPVSINSAAGTATYRFYGTPSFCDETSVAGYNGAYEYNGHGIIGYQHIGGYMDLPYTSPASSEGRGSAGTDTTSQEATSSTTGTSTNEQAQQAPQAASETQSETPATSSETNVEEQVTDKVSIGTKATDASDGDKNISADSEVFVKEEVTFIGLEPATNYTLKATLMDAETGEVVKRPVNIFKSEDVSTEMMFIADNTASTQTVTLRFDATKLANHRLVVFLRLYDASNGQLIAKQTNINDEASSVYVYSQTAAAAFGTDSPIGSTVTKIGSAIGLLAIVAAAFIAVVAVFSYRARNRSVWR